VATPPPPGTLSYPPLPGPIAGIYAVNAPWAQWFRELWNRVGGPDALTNTELQTLIVQQTPGPPGPPGGGTGQDVSDPFLSGALSAVTDAQATTLALHTLHKRLDDLETLVLANQPPPAAAVPLSTMTALWNWSTVDDPFAGDPGAPNAAFDVALAPLNLRVARRTLDNRDASAILATVQPGDVWTIESPSVSTIWVRFEVNTALSHFPTYFTYPGTVLATGAGGQPTANMPVTLTLTRMAGLEDAGSDTETPFIRTALDLDNRVAALENLPLDSVTQSVNDLRSRMEAVEVLAMINLAPPVPPGVALLGYTNTFTQGQTINQNLNPHLLGGTTPVPLFGAGSILLVNAPDNVNAVLTFNGYGVFGGNFAGTRMRLPGGLPGPLAAGNLIFAFQALGFDGAAYSASSQAGWETRARNLWSTTDHSTYYVVQTTPSGSVTPQNVLGLYDGMILPAGSGGSAPPTGGDKGLGTINLTIGVFLQGNQVAGLGTLTSNEALFGTNAAQSVLRSSLAVRSSLATPAQGDIWVEAAGTSPARTARLYVWDGGGAHQLASVTY